MSAGGGIGCGTALGLIFVTLKLTDNIDWSWFWVLSPFWIPLVLVVAILGALCFLAATLELLGVKTNRGGRRY